MADDRAGAISLAVFGSERFRGGEEHAASRAREAAKWKKRMRPG
jgi:hypothetical protein